MMTPQQWDKGPSPGGDKHEIGRERFTGPEHFCSGPVI